MILRHKGALMIDTWRPLLMSSSNPFRRKINDPPSNIPANPAGTATAQPLSINTGTKAEKHVRIASPPDTAISPASYPSSPEFTRLKPSPQQTVVPHNFNAIPQVQAIKLPEASDSSGDEDYGLVSEALNNTRLNIASTRVPAVELTYRPEDAVQNTLSKFASRPRDGSTVNHSAAEAPKQESKRQTMDVDAFTRLLLTGGSTQSTTGSSNVTGTGPPNALSESSSTADSASISRQSIFEPVIPIATDSPRTSHELDEAESVAARRAVTSFSETLEVVKRNPSKPPPAPKPRHGKPIKQNQLPFPDVIRQAPLIPPMNSPPPEPRSPESDLNKPLPPPPASIPTSDASRRTSSASVLDTDLLTKVKRPPTPPLSRRRSQDPNKPPVSRSSTSSNPLSGNSPSLSTTLPLSHATNPPPPPPSRRSSQRSSQTANPSSLPYTSEEDPIDLSKPIMPQLSRTTSTATRTSILSSDSTAPVPPPPRRRHRGSSSTSQRPSLGATSVVAVAGSGRSSIEGQRPGSDSTRKSSIDSGRDILKDLASLQAEVDALRRRGFRE